MAIKFLCPSCHAFLKVADHLAGRRVRCANCKSSVEVPGSVEVEPLLDQPIPKSKPTAPSVILNGIGYGGFILVLALAACVIAGVSFWAGSDHLAAATLRYVLWLILGFSLLMSAITLLRHVNRRPVSVLLGLLPGGALVALAMLAQIWFHGHLFPGQSIWASQSNLAVNETLASGRSMDEAEEKLHQLRRRRDSIQNLLEKTTADKDRLIARLKQSGVSNTEDLKERPQSRVLVNEFQRLVGEVQGLERAIDQIDEAIVQSEAWMRSIERSEVLGEAGLTEEEMKQLSTQLLLADESEVGDLPAIAMDPSKLDELLQAELNRGPQLQAKKEPEAFPDNDEPLSQGTSQPEKLTTPVGQIEKFTMEFEPTSGNKNEPQQTLDQFDELLARLPSLIKLEPDGPPQVANKTEDSATLNIKLKVKVNSSDYREFAEELCLLLKDQVIDQGEWNGQFRTVEPYLSPGGIEEVVWKWMPKAIDSNRTNTDGGSVDFIYFCFA